jgi:predicted DNA repair protein MutK
LAAVPTALTFCCARSLRRLPLFLILAAQPPNVLTVLVFIGGISETYLSFKQHEITEEIFGPRRDEATKNGEY